MGNDILNDDIMSSIIKISDGNPGAISVIMQLVENNNRIDPDDIFSYMGIGFILTFDEYKIYGSDIWVLYKDQCNSDIRKLIMLFRAAQLGLTSMNKILEISKDNPNNIKLTDDEMNYFDEQVCIQIPNFMKKETWEKERK